MCNVMKNNTDFKGILSQMNNKNNMNNNNNNLN